MFSYLEKNGIDNFVGVPDSTLKNFIKEGGKFITHVPVPRII